MKEIQPPCCLYLVGNPLALLSLQQHLRPLNPLTDGVSSSTVELGVKTIFIQVEVVDAPLDYNLLLGRNWFYAMTAVASTVFRTVQFPHLGRIITID